MVTFFAVLVLLLALATMPAGSTGQITLATLKGRARPVLVFAPSAQDTRMIRQLEEFNSNTARLVERDVVVIPLPAGGSSPAANTFSPQEQSAARQRFHIPPQDFTVLLLGKDGGEKLRTHGLLSVEELDKTIDAMPMRQEEMRRQANHPGLEIPR